jgi:hypothetical protein
MSIQLKGSASFCPSTNGASAGPLVDFKNYISSLVINRERSSVTVPATLGTGRETTKAGTLSESVTITFHSDFAAAGFWAEMYDAITTDGAELYFESVLNEGAVSADNPKFKGTIVVLTLETGADVGSLRQQSQTYPVTVAGITKSAT